MMNGWLVCVHMHARICTMCACARVCACERSGVYWDSSMDVAQCYMFPTARRRMRSTPRDPPPKKTT